MPNAKGMCLKEDLNQEEETEVTIPNEPAHNLMSAFILAAYFILLSFTDGHTLFGLDAIQFFLQWTSPTYNFRLKAMY
jgi:hypothetical protein